MPPKRRCTTCHCYLESDESGACQDCRGVIRNIHEAHALRATQDQYDRTESARREARLIARGRVGT